MHKMGHYFLHVSIIAILCLTCGDAGFCQTDVTLFEYGKNLYLLDEKKLYDTTVGVLNSYLIKYPQGEKAAEAQITLADLHMRRKETDRAFISYLKTIALYPEMTQIQRANDGAREAASKDMGLSPIKEKLFSLLVTPPRESEFADTYLAVLHVLRDLVYPKLNNALIPECQAFLDTYPNHSGAAQVAEWIGDMYEENKKPWEAVAAYLRVVHTYKGNDHVLGCQLKIADLMTERLKKHEEAVAMYQAILKSEVDSLVGSEIRWKMACVFHDKLLNYSRAAQEYQNMVDLFPASSHSVEALMRKAEIQISKLKQPEGGIDTYRKISEGFPEDEHAPEALAKAGEVYEKKMKDYANAVQIYQEVSEKYPSSFHAPEKLFAAAELTEKKLKEINRAIAIYQKVVDAYGQEKVAERARKKIESLRKKIGEG